MDLATYAAVKGYRGASAWFRVQAQEETGHAVKFYQYMLSQGAQPELKAIAAPPAEFGEYQNLFAEALKHEQFITKSIHELVEQAQAEKDHATGIMLQYFVTEQVEEEESVQDILADLALTDGTRGLLMIDRELGRRGGK